VKLLAARAKWVMPLIEEAADRFGVTPEEVMSSRKLRTVATARAYAIWLARTRFGWSYPELGIVFGSDHTTCRSACIATEKRLGKEPKSGPRLVKVEPRDTLPAPTDGELLELGERFA
jgi:chromosomal replication initiation ATPase DnaA